MRAFIAGPLFNAGERWFNEQIVVRAVRAGLTTYLPQRDHIPRVTDKQSAEFVFRANERAIDAAAIVIANLDGGAVESGTAWELGYAYAQGKHLVGIRTDMRITGQSEEINLMVEYSLHELVWSLDELETVLIAYVAAESPPTA
jgi:nucleoside 2-deoxyribosyltransferase